ncbi:MAG: hypothetical protein R3191_04380 [Anaerolineales bacterium]|nr:hypothetical protein [Anaerolineales bacterium]
MPVNLQVVGGDEFIRARPTGQLDLEQSKELILKIAALESGRELSEALINLRHVEADLSVANVYELVSKFARSKQGRHKRLAVLVHPEGFDHAEFLELTAQNRGFDLRSFERCGEALDWLMGEPDG